MDRFSAGQSRSGLGRWPRIRRARTIGALSSLLLWWAGACTEPNPNYEPLDGGVSCEPGQRRCADELVMVCIPDGDSTRLAPERLCPENAPCAQGQCVPRTRQSCAGGCPGGQECSVFVDQAGTGLEMLCTAAVGDLGGTAPCNAGSACRSGLCLVVRGETGCYMACVSQDADNSCPRGFECRDLTLTIDGVQDSVQGCVSQGNP